MANPFLSAPTTSPFTSAQFQASQPLYTNQQGIQTKVSPTNQLGIQTNVSPFGQQFMNPFV
jgi:hypothetical protein